MAIRHIGLLPRIALDVKKVTVKTHKAKERATDEHEIQLLFERFEIHDIVALGTRYPSQPHASRGTIMVAVLPIHSQSVAVAGGLKSIGYITPPV